MVPRAESEELLRLKIGLEVSEKPPMLARAIPSHSPSEHLARSLSVRHLAPWRTASVCRRVSPARSHPHPPHITLRSSLTPSRSSRSCTRHRDARAPLYVNADAYARTPVFAPPRTCIREFDSAARAPRLISSHRTAVLSDLARGAHSLTLPQSSKK